MKDEMFENLYENQFCTKLPSLICVFALGLKFCLVLFFFLFFGSIIDVRTTTSAVLSPEN